MSPGAVGLPRGITNLEFTHDDRLRDGDGTDKTNLRQVLCEVPIWQTMYAQLHSCSSLLYKEPVLTARCIKEKLVFSSITEFHI